MSHQDLTHSMTGTQAEFLARAYSLPSTSAARALYSEWAASYDRDLTSGAYASPLKAVEALLSHLPTTSALSNDSAVAQTQDLNPALTVLDAGCGTGMVASCLIPSATLTGQTFVIDGVDLTPEMLDVAREKGLYGKLSTADLNEPLMIVDGKYDAVMCVGTLTKGHVGPRVLAEFVRVVKRQGGMVVATVHEEVWESGGYAAEVEALQAAGAVDVLGTDEFGLIEGQSRGGRMVVLRKR